MPRTPRVRRMRRWSTRRGRSRLDVGLLRRLLAAIDALGASLERASTTATRFEAPVQARVERRRPRVPARCRVAPSRRCGGRAPAGRRPCVGARHDRRGRARPPGGRGRRGAAAAGRVARGGCRTRLAGGRARRRGRRPRGLAARATRLEARREALGRVNPLAKEEYEAEGRARGARPRSGADLEASLAELEALRGELTETVNKRFDETFAAVARNFEEVAATLFPGGDGRLLLVEAGRGEDGEGGVEVELRPAGRRSPVSTCCRAARRRSVRSRSCSRCSSPSRAPSTSSTRSRRRSTIRTSRASSSSYVATLAAPSSS